VDPDRRYFTTTGIMLHSFYFISPGDLKNLHVLAACPIFRRTSEMGTRDWVVLFSAPDIISAERKKRGKFK
jgi:hypothetical protein